MTESAKRCDVAANSLTRKPSFGLLLVLLAVLSMSVYAVTLGAPLVWDDHELVSQVNQSTHSWLSVWTRPFWSAGALSPAAYYRPLTLLSFRLDVSLYGDNPAGFHLTNILLHTTNAVLLASLARRCGAGVIAATVASFAFALSPRLTESVAWVSGRTDLLALFWVLCALLLWRVPRVGPVLGALACACGMLSKEVALAGAVALIVFELRSDAPRRLLAWRLSPLFAFGVIVLLVRGVELSNIPSPCDGLGFGARLITAFEALGNYAFMLVDPWQPNLQIGWLGSPRYAFVALGGLVLLTFGVAALKFWPKLNPAQAAFVALGAAALALVLHLVPLPVGVVAADRFLYLPIAALALTVSTCF
ncbi:MAG TPA: hypothetical protein VGM44_07915, partial [Polyangiaceae bacterium]